MMKITRTSLLRSVGLAAALTLVALPAMAGGPLANCAPGVAFLWENDGQNIPFNPDQGDLGPLTNAQAVAAVQQAFDVWGAIPTATLSYVDAGPLPVDVDINNFGPYLNAPAPDGFSAVVFDDTGEIFELLFGPGTGVLGFAGPEWGNTITCEIFEALSFLNGPSFTNATAALDVMVHEFGHWTNFAHTVVNGQIYLGSVGGDNTGPTPFDTFGAAPNPFTDIIETMYPFYYGPGIGTASLEADDIAIASRMYPDPSYAATTGEISGQILLGSERLTGVNVIARNVANPFNDAVSAISSDFTDNTGQSDPNVGLYRITGLTPGADYGVYVDQILAGGFSTAVASPLPGPEELYNGADESGDPNTDDPSVFTPVTTAAGSPNTGIDIIFNQPLEGDPLPVGDDGSVLLSLPFPVTICEQEFSSVFVNANGNLTFGAPDSDFTESSAEMLAGPPRIAGAWDDLQPFDIFGDPQGSVFFTTTPSTFTVTYENVPEWGFFGGIGSNTFSIELQQGSTQARVDYDDISMPDGLAGVTCGIHDTGGLEPEIAINNLPISTTHNFNGETAVYEWFSSLDNDLDNYNVKYNTLKHDLSDVFEPNNSLADAAPISTPFSSAPNSNFTEISPAAADIDFFSFTAEEGKYIILETTRGQVDTVLGLFNSAGVLIGFNDDTNGLLSRIEGFLPADDTYTVAVTFCCDFDFDGVDPGQGLPFDEGRYVLEVGLFDGLPLPLGDEVVLNLSGFGFSFPYDGSDYGNVYISSNGFISFGAPEFDFTPSIAEFENESPRVAPLWEDLDATGALVLADTDFATELTITFVDVPEFGGFGANNFSVTLFSNGNVQYDYGSVTVAAPLIGAAEGLGQSSTATDFSATGGGNISDSPVELFTGGSPYDLSDPASLVFVP